jgi:uncharacterized protein (DUF608 family)
MTPAQASARNIYRKEQLRALAMPLGGLGTGSIALCGDGSLRQWQIHNQVNHIACIPHSFFAVWVLDSLANAPATVRVLQSLKYHNAQTPIPPPTSNDHIVPAAQRRLMEQLPGVSDIEFRGEYPIAEIKYSDAALPIPITLQAFNPFIPLNGKDSGLPIILFQFTLTNSGARPLQTALMATLQNAVGWDGVAEIVDTRCRLYGGNSNTLLRREDFTAILMEHPQLAPNAAEFGSMALGTFEPHVTYRTSWDDLQTLWLDLSADGKLDDVKSNSPSAGGRTWNGALATGSVLEPGETRTFTFFYTWHFPNRYVNFEQGSVMDAADKGRSFRIGNQYNNWFSSALDVAKYVSANRERLVNETCQAREVLFDTNLPNALVDAYTSQVSILRTPTCFWTEDGRFYGFEGGGGASTPHIPEGFGGSCPLNCTHVWNYEMALARLFPDLERNMRETEWLLQQHPSGYLPHRVLLPIELPRPWGRRIGGPAKPALDGLLGAILKTYREYRADGDLHWLKSVWNHVTLTLEYVWQTYDPTHSGVIKGEQPNTYDISIYGANTFIGTLYLAALAATSRMARLVGETKLEEQYDAVCERGRAELERRLWNGDYYIQDVDLYAHPEHKWGKGCLSDQLLGQWWADRLALGDVLEPEHVNRALDSIVRHNLRENFAGHVQQPRAFVTDEDAGLLNCTWREGERPAVPIPYADEVWTGIEYEVAALLLQRGQAESAVRIVEATRARYDGRKQNPWNEIECGDHYVRAMASWSLLEAALGYAYDAAAQEICFRPNISPDNIRAPFFTRDGWGTFEQHAEADKQIVTLTLGYGTLALQRLVLENKVAGAAGQPNPFSWRKRVWLTSHSHVLGAEIPVSVTVRDGTIKLEFLETLALHAGETLTIEMSKISTVEKAYGYFTL